MIKLFLMLVIAGVVYVGLNWDQISGQVRSGMDTVDEAKVKVMDMKDIAEHKVEEAKDKLDDIQDSARDKIEGTKNAAQDLLDKFK